VPTSLQYPLERERALERRWHRLLQRTVAPKKDLRQDRRASASPRPSPSSQDGDSYERSAGAACGLLALLLRNPAPTL
jgi:hypothetical protein